jgi:tetratricopeptide (TPR) repeat protein
VNGVQGGLSDESAVYYVPPEAPKTADEQAAENKNVAPMEIAPLELNYIFSANYKYYQKNPVGRISVNNNTDSDFTNVKLSFNLKDFMDFPSDTVVPLVKAKSQVQVDLMATLNNRMLNITEDTPIQCQLTLTYYQDGAEKTFTLNKPVKVLSKNAIIWDKADRLANFITAKDTPVFSFSRTALLQKSDFGKDSQYLNDNLITADMAWEALGEYGMTYISEAVSPFEVIKSSKAFPIDTVHFARTTLKLKSGNCADLTALFASILEGAGLHTALLDYPAHIALMFDTGDTDARDVGLPEEYLIKYNNTWWVGVETTMIGKNFYDAIKHEADLYRSMSGDVKVVDVRNAWVEFEPVTLPEAEPETYPDKTAVDNRVAASLAALEKVRYDYLKKYFDQILIEAPDDADANINLGILLAQNGETDGAVKYLGKVLEKDPVNASALNNLGNVSFNGGKYAEARDYYFKASKSDPYDAGIWLNLARVADKQGKKDDVKAFVEKAEKLDPSVKATGDKLLN